MVNSIPDEYEIDPGTDIDRLADILLAEYPKAARHDVEEAIFVNEGPVDYLAWLALDGYERHEFFYYDTESDQTVIRQLLSWSPNRRRECRQFKGG